MRVIYPGSFDPIHWGHLDIIQRAANLFDEVVIVVMANGNKQYKVSVDDRVKLIEKAISSCLSQERREKIIVYVDTKNLLAKIAEDLRADAIIRGVRPQDWAYEVTLAEVVKKNIPIETIFLPANSEDSYLSSSVVREMAHYHNTFGFVPETIREDVERLYE